MARIKIPVSFAYVNGSNLDPVVGSSLTVINRTTQLPATVYQAESESNPATYNTLATDSQGNVPGWVEPGSYQITAAAQGGFGGATSYFEAVRGDGVTNVATAAIDMAQLAQDVLNALVPTGTILDFGGQTAPTGYVLCDGSTYPIGTVGSTYYNLSQELGTVWNTGGEGSGYFRVPDLRAVVTVGSSASNSGAPALGAASGGGLTAKTLGPRKSGGLTAGGEETHSLLGVENGSHNHGGTTGIDSPDHSHYTSGTTGTENQAHNHGYGYATNGGATYNIGYQGGSQSVATIPDNDYGASSTTGTENQAHNHNFGAQSGGASVRHTHLIASDGSGIAHNNMQPYAVVQKIIKL